MVKSKQAIYYNSQVVYNDYQRLILCLQIYPQNALKADDMLLL